MAWLARFERLGLPIADLGEDAAARIATLMPNVSDMTDADDRTLPDTYLRWFAAP